MRALVKVAPGEGNVELREVDDPELGPGQVMVRVGAVGVCGTDRHAIEGLDGFPTPRVLGHEVSGVVEAIAADAEADGLAVGDRVTLETNAYLCGACRYCQQGEDNRCPHRLAIGTTTDGGLADRIAIRAPSVHRLPEGISLAAGALVEPLSVSVHAVVEQGPPLAGEVVVVVGPGAVGLLVAQVARALGATVVLVGRARHGARLAVGRSLGIGHAVDGDAVDVAALVRELSGGVGARALFECSGGTGVVEETLGLLQRGGRVVLVAFFKRPPALDVDAVINRELEVVGSRGKRSSDYRRALRLVAEGQVALEPLITARLPLADWRRGIELTAAGEKVVFELSS